MEKIPPIGFLKIDYTIQRILGILIVVSLIYFPIAMLLLIPFGAWQVLSGIIGAAYGSRWRVFYLIAVFIYFIIMITGVSLSESDNPIAESDFLAITFVAIILASPLILGITYLVRTKQDIPEKTMNKSRDKDMSDVLDSDLV